MKTASGTTLSLPETILVNDDMFVVINVEDLSQHYHGGEKSKLSTVLA
jgi:hypothetical protein